MPATNTEHLTGKSSVFLARISRLWHTFSRSKRHKNDQPVPKIQNHHKFNKFTITPLGTIPYSTMKLLIISSTLYLASTLFSTDAAGPTFLRGNMNIDEGCYVSCAIIPCQENCEDSHTAFHECVSNCEANVTDFCKAECTVGADESS